MGLPRFTWWQPWQMDACNPADEFTGIELASKLIAFVEAPNAWVAQ